MQVASPCRSSGVHPWKMSAAANIVAINTAVFGMIYSSNISILVKNRLTWLSSTSTSKLFTLIFLIFPFDLKMGSSDASSTAFLSAASQPSVDDPIVSIIFTTTLISSCILLFNFPHNHRAVAHMHLHILLLLSPDFVFIVQHGLQLTYTKYPAQHFTILTALFD